MTASSHASWPFPRRSLGAHSREKSAGRPSSLARSGARLLWLKACRAEGRFGTTVMTTRGGPADGKQGTQIWVLRHQIPGRGALRAAATRTPTHGAAHSPIRPKVGVCVPPQTASGPTSRTSALASHASCVVGSVCTLAGRQRSAASKRCGRRLWEGTTPMPVTWMCCRSQSKGTGALCRGRC